MDRTRTHDLARILLYVTLPLISVTIVTAKHQHTPLTGATVAMGGSGSNRAENNTYGWTSTDGVVIGWAAGGFGRCLAWLPMRLVGVLEVGFRVDAGVRG